MKVLLDSLYVNNSGGKILLDYLVETLETEQVNVFYLFDERCKESYEWVPEERKAFIKPSLLLRHSFYKKFGSKFSKVLCFGNIPPTVKLDSEVLTYLHQPLYFVQPPDIGLKKKALLFFKVWIIKQTLKHTNSWGVQSQYVAKLIENGWNVLPNKIQALPFYPPLESEIQVKRSDDIYLFVSGGNSHKNHYRLIKAFAEFNKQFPQAELHLTISENFKHLLEYIDSQKQQGVKIVNHGFIPRENLARLYKASGFAIYPSLTESFGLGLIEAVELGCKIIASDLPYVHAVCEASLIFDPLQTESIHQALVKSKTQQLQPSFLKVKNQIQTLMSFFTNETTNTVI